MFENHDVKLSVILSVIHNNSYVMQTFYEKEQSNWYPSHALVLRSQFPWQYCALIESVNLV